MATLEKIRSKSGILFAIIILALLAFILGDFLTSSRSLTGPGTTAAKVAGQKINFQKFQQNVEQQRQQMQAQGYPDVDIAQLQNEVLQQMIFEALMEQEIDNMGITVTDRELSEMMVGENPLPQVVQIVRQYGFNSPVEFYDYSHNPGKYGLTREQAMQLDQAWNALETQTANQWRQQKLANLFSGALTANKLDAKAYYDENASTAKVAYVKKDISTVSNDEAPLTNEDILAVYNNRKERYHLNEETRPIEYILVEIVPSETDKLAAQKEIEDALVALREQPGTEGVSDNLNFVVNRASSPLQAIPLVVRNRIDSLKEDNVQILSAANNVYNILKLVNTYNDIDSVQFDMVAIPGNAEVRDSIVALLNAGENVDTLIANGLIAEKVVDQKVYVPSAGALTETYKDAPLNTYIIPEMMSDAESGIALKVTKRNQPVMFYDVAQITYTVDPSPTTISNLRNDLQAYVDSNKTVVAFVDNANSKGYNAHSAVVTPSSLGVANIKDTRGAAKWAMNARKGEVSKVFGDEQAGHYIAVAVKDVYNGGYVPANDPDLNRELNMRASAIKKGEKLMADYAGKADNLAGYSELMGMQPDTTEVTFSRGDVRGFPYGQSSLIANASIAEKGQLVGPFATDNAVVVLQILDIDKIGRDFDYENDAMMFNQQQGAALLSRNIYEILLGKNKITNNLQKFYNE